MSRNPEHKPKPQPQQKRQNYRKRGPKNKQGAPAPPKQKNHAAADNQNGSNAPNEHQQQPIASIGQSNSELTTSFLRKRIQQSNEQISFLSNERDALRKELGSLQAQLDEAYIEFEERTAILENENLQLRQDFEARVQEFQTLDQQRSSLKDTMESYQHLFQTLTADKEKAEAEARKEKEAVQVLQKEREYFRMQWENLKLENRDLKGKVSDLKVENRDLKGKVSAFEKAGANASRQNAHHVDQQKSHGGRNSPHQKMHGTSNASTRQNVHVEQKKSPGGKNSVAHPAHSHAPLNKAATMPTPASQERLTNKASQQSVLAKVSTLPQQASSKNAEPQKAPSSKSTTVADTKETPGPQSIGKKGDSASKVASAKGAKANFAPVEISKGGTTKEVAPDSSLSRNESSSPSSSSSKEASGCVEKQAPPLEPKPKSATNKQTEPESNGGTGDSVEKLKTQASDAEIVPTKAIVKVKKPPRVPVSPKQLLENVDLASFLFPIVKKPDEVSPVFALFRNPETKSKGRQLLDLGTRLSRLQADLEKAYKTEAKIRASIDKEEKEIKNANNRIKKNQERIQGVSLWKYIMGDKEKEEDEKDKELLKKNEEKGDEQGEDGVDLRAVKNAEKAIEKRAEQKRKTEGQKAAEKKKAEDEIEKDKKRISASEGALETYRPELSRAQSRVFALKASIDPVLARVSLLLGDLTDLTTLGSSGGFFGRLWGSSESSESESKTSQIEKAAERVEHVADTLQSLLADWDRHQVSLEKVEQEIAETNLNIANINEKIKELRGWKCTWTKPQIQAIKYDEEILLAAFQKGLEIEEKLKNIKQHLVERVESRMGEGVAVDIDGLRKQMNFDDAEESEEPARSEIEKRLNMLYSDCEFEKEMSIGMLNARASLKRADYRDLRKAVIETSGAELRELQKHLDATKKQLQKQLQSQGLQRWLEYSDIDIEQEQLNSIRSRLKECENELQSSDKKMEKVMKKINGREQQKLDTSRENAAKLVELASEATALNKSLESLAEDRVRSKRTVAEAMSRFAEKEAEAKKAVLALSKLVESSELAKLDDKSTPSIDINGATNERGLTLLEASIFDSDLDTLQMCLDQNADVNRKGLYGFPPLMAAVFFGLDDISNCLSKHGARVDDESFHSWSNLIKGKNLAPRYLQDWQGTLKIAEQAAVAVDELFDQAENYEKSESKRMPYLTEEEKTKLSLTFFETSLLNPNMKQEAMRRTILLENSVLEWLLVSKTPREEKRSFIDVLESFIPGRKTTASFEITRRSIAGFADKSYEVLGVNLSQSTITLFSPFVSSEVDGKFDVGILVWAVVPVEKASLYSVLIQNTDFMRNKVESDDRFPAHREMVLELGKDMHLLDLRSSSIYTSRPMDLYKINVDEELYSMGDPEFIPEKRKLDADKRLSAAIFGTDHEEAETKANNAILSGSRKNMSTQLYGGAGTGKTLLMTKKLISEDAGKKILVLSRLPRLVSAIKAKVEEERETTNVVFTTYEDLCSKLAKHIQAEKGLDIHFPIFSRVQYGGTVSGVSFGSFIDYLSDRERNRMKLNKVEPATLWGGIRTIKSNTRCVQSLRVLTREEYQDLPVVFGLNKEQRDVVYDFFLIYEEWLQKDGHKWDEADRVMFILKHGHAVYSDPEYMSWKKRYLQGLGEGLADDDGQPLSPYFYHKVFVDEAQDFSELDLALFLRMSAGIRQVFLAADPAQSVEVGLRMREGTVNDVYHASLDPSSGLQVKDTIQTLEMFTNHRTHAGNLEFAKGVRKMLTRSFGIRGTRENSLIKGEKPKALLTSSIEQLADAATFRGPNVVFLAPDENIPSLKETLHKAGISNDIFGVREAKGLEFDAVALIGFFSYFEHRKSAEPWRNMLLWLFSTKGITVKQSSEEITQMGRARLEACDYLLSHPEVEDEAMLLYTALTRARNKLYVIEFEKDGIRRQRGENSLAEFAFRCLKHDDLGLLDVASHIDEGKVEMSPQEHKARGVLMVTNAIEFARTSSSSNDIRAKFEEALKRFTPKFGDDKDLHNLATKHMEAFLLKNRLVGYLKRKFFDQKTGKYHLDGKFDQLLAFEKDLVSFMDLAAWDTFLMDDFHEIVSLVEEMVEGTPYAIRLGEYCLQLRDTHEEWFEEICKSERKPRSSYS